MVVDWIERVLHGLLAWWRGDTLSHHWLRQQDQLEARVEFEGVKWRWPGPRA